MTLLCFMPGSPPPIQYRSRDRLYNETNPFFFFQVQLPFDSQMQENTLCEKKLCWVTAASKLDIFLNISSTSCSYIALLQILLVTFTHYKICMCCCMHKDFKWTCLIRGVPCLSWISSLIYVVDTPTGISSIDRRRYATFLLLQNGALDPADSSVYQTRRSLPRTIAAERKPFRFHSRPPECPDP
jgi:hypothetical protein